MRTQLYQVLRKLASLPGLRLVPWGNRQWQKSSTQSLLFWLLATLVVYKLVSRLGHSVSVNLTVSLSLDWIAYVINRFWVWQKRQTHFRRSGLRNFAVWGVTAGLNALMAWQIISRIGVMPGRALLGCYGIAMNPVMFRVRDNLVFAEYDIGEIREVAAARCKMEMNKAMALSRLMLTRTGGV
jgi:putative flippase GtrA